MRRAGLCGAVAAAALVFDLACARAAEPAVDPYEKGSITVELENDRFANSDRHYTHGTRLSWLSRPIDPDNVPELFRAPYGWLPIFDREGKRRIGVALGQNIYTPEATDRTDLIRNDRPYAGWLYVGTSLNNESDNRLDTVELDVGMVGPSAQARQVQNGFHSLIGAAKSRGWDNQLKDELGVALVAERRWRHGVVDGIFNRFAVDAIPHAGVSLGNVQTYGSVGGVVRLGEDLPADFGPPHIRPSLPGSATFDNSSGFGWYVFASAEARGVARDIFLDGNTFRDSPRVDKKHVVADFQLGIAVLIDSVRISYTQVFRTREFEEQRGADRFGAFSLTWRL